MAQVKFATVQKPMDKRLMDAACIYWEVSEDFFKVKKRDADTQKRHIFFYMLKEHADLQPAYMAAEFGWHKSSIYEAIETIETTKNIYPTIARSMRDILKIAETLHSTIVVTDIRLENLNNDELHT